MRRQGTPSQQLAELYREHGSSLYRRARALTGDAEEATDVMQDTFVSFMNMRAPLRGDATPFTILYQIVTHRAVDRLRRRARWTGRMALSEQRLDMATEYEGGLSQVDAAQDLALLTEGEDPQVLTAAFLHFVEGHGVKQVGQVLKLSRHEVRKILDQFMARARAKQARLDAEVTR